MNTKQLDDMALAVYELKMVQSILKNNTDDMDADTTRFSHRKLTEIIKKLEGQLK
jgi:hypothetical protein